MTNLRMANTFQFIFTHLYLIKFVLWIFTIVFSFNENVSVESGKLCNRVPVVILTVLRHYFPQHHKILAVFRKLKGDEEPIVEVAQGKLRGKTGKDYDNNVFYSFQGIPYAKPPLGPLKFKAPQPAEPWAGIRDATHEGKDCFSKHTWLRTLIGSEDCLTLNVYTQKFSQNDQETKKPKAVMVWIHGGGFTSGSGSTEAYGPEFLLTEDVVLVTINYRTNILGFLSLEDPSLEVPGNAGLKDIVMALKWIQENIHHFCGDPKNVTIFGNSAGAAAVHYLILSPKAKNLFHKAILQSGCALNVWARGRVYTEEIAKVLGKEDADDETILRTLQNLSPHEMYRKVETVKDPFLACSIRPHGPVVEKKSEDAFLWEEPLEIIKSGNYNHVPIMVGYATREGMLGEILQKPRDFQPITNFEISVPYMLNLEKGTEPHQEVAAKIKKFYYRDEEPSTENKEPYYLLESDNFFIRELLFMVEHHLETTDCPMYLFEVSAETRLNLLKQIYKLSEPGVCHADELGYLFKNVLTPKLEKGCVEDIAIRRFVKFWTNFAKFGDPNVREANEIINVKWEPVQKDKVNYIELGTTLKTGFDPASDRMRFWKSIFAEYLNK